MALSSVHRYGCGGRVRQLAVLAMPLLWCAFADEVSDSAQLFPLWARHRLVFMSEDGPLNGKRRLAQALVAAPGIIFLFLALHGLFADYRHMQYLNRRAEARTALAEATIVETHGLVSGKGLRIAEGAGTFTFTTASGQEVRFPYRGFSGSPGTKLPVRYDPRNPANWAGGDSRWGFSELIGNAPFFLMGLYFLFLAMKLGRRNA
jgi:hypothetical protein